jgi:putative flippase GtrA
MGVSVVTTVMSLAMIVVATAGFAVGAALANVIATAIATVPSYHLNRRWTWAKRDRSDPWREVLPFWLLSFAGLALSTVTVALADSWASRARLAPMAHTVAIMTGHVGGFGLLWVLQFVLLDRVLFARAS